MDQEQPFEVDLYTGWMPDVSEGKGMRVVLALRFAGIFTTLASAIFMLWAFYQMAFMHRGALFYEPNIAIATSEFFLVIVGIVGMILGFGAFIDEVTKPKTDGTVVRFARTTTFDANATYVILDNGEVRRVDV